jgi:hypothetical protein
MAARPAARPRLARSGDEGDAEHAAVNGAPKRRRHEAAAGAATEARAAAAGSEAGAGGVSSASSFDASSFAPATRLVDDSAREPPTHALPLALESPPVAAAASASASASASAAAAAAPVAAPGSEPATPRGKRHASNCHQVLAVMQAIEELIQRRKARFVPPQSNLEQWSEVAARASDLYLAKFPAAAAAAARSRLTPSASFHIYHNFKHRRPPHDPLQLEAFNAALAIRQRFAELDGGRADRWHGADDAADRLAKHSLAARERRLSASAAGPAPPAAAAAAAAAATVAGGGGSSSGVSERLLLALEAAERTQLALVAELARLNETSRLMLAALGVAAPAAAAAVSASSSSSASSSAAAAAAAASPL